MTKQDIIDEAYSKLKFYKAYELQGNDGWACMKYYAYRNPTEFLIEGDIDVITAFKTETGEFSNETMFYLFRPKSLRGIDDNNGWIKIEGPEDLPQSLGEHHVVYDNEIITTANYVGNGRWTTAYNNYPKTTKNLGLTHYQPIQKLQPPVY